ncbi:MAG: GNAT family N-acetyltransferase [Acidimicrobiales bacterium]
MQADGESARRARISDGRDIVRLAKDYFSVLQSARGGSALIPRVRSLVEVDAVEKAIMATGNALVVGLYEGVVAGFAYAIVVDDASGTPRVEVESMYIDPPLRRVGVGEAMIGEVARFAHDSGADSIDVIALPGDGATKSFLEASGFRARLLVMHRSEKRS